MFTFSLRIFLRNILGLFAFDYRIVNREQWKAIRDYITIDNLRHFKETDGVLFKDEIDFILKHGAQVFPYKKVKSMGPVNSGYDKRAGLPYVMHNGKKLFFKKSMKVKEAEEAYRSYIEDENLLGGGYRVKMPHQYQSENVKVEQGDIFVDIGSAEGLVALDVIDKVKKVYLLEGDKKWLPSLHATFRPYKDKCQIIPKYVSDCNSKCYITLEQLLKDEPDCPVFIKMDIEGYEKIVLDSSRDFIAKRKNIKLAVCTYHNQEDAKDIALLFERLGYHYEQSDGYMLFTFDPQEIPKPPFFRKGMIRAWK